MGRLEFSQLKCISMREELIDYLQCLSDKDCQQRAWVEHTLSEGGYDELDYAVHFLFDDTALATDPVSTVGWILLNEVEAGLIEKVTTSLNVIFEKYGLELDDKDYIATKEWGSVLISAEAAKQYMCSES
ncbi:hypothetical protein D9M70_423780 [compost metagenome]